MNPTPNNQKMNWYVAYTYPNFEKKVYNALNRNDIECFLPLQKVERQWSDRKKLLEVPIFPNYIFVHTSATKRYQVLTVPGIVRYVAFDNSPVIISEKEINTVKKLVTLPGFTKEVDLERGDEVKIVAGPFAGLEGVLIERKGRTRFAIKIEVINQAVSVDMDNSYLQKIETRVLV